MGMLKPFNMALNVRDHPKHATRESSRGMLMPCPEDIHMGLKI